METPLQVVFKGMDPSDAVRTRIEERATKLDKIFDRITSCRVVVELPHRHRKKGKLFNITIDLVVPGDRIIVTRAPSANHAREDVYVALRDAFNTAQRQLEEFARRIRGLVKTHGETPSGHIKSLVPDQDCGFIETADGREIYFHRNSVLTGYDRLKVGDSVKFAEELGDKGPKATTVQAVD